MCGVHHPVLIQQRFNMIDPVYTLNKLGLAPGMSVSRAITTIGLMFSESSNPLNAANKVIVSFGGNPVSTPLHADIIAKALIEQAVLFGPNYDSEQAAIVAADKFKKISATMPYLFAATDSSTTSENRAGTEKSHSNDKKVNALEIYNREKGKAGGEIAKIIATELDITYANAYYYVSRVFAKYKS